MYSLTPTLVTCSLYSNVGRDLLMQHVKRASQYAGFSEETINYIDNLVVVNMEHSYFYELAGIFLTTSGFSMGDISALRDSELDTFPKLDSYSLLEKNEHYFRFKDDVNADPQGTRDEVLQSIKIISTSYHQELQLNVEINMVQGKFLNLRIYNQVDTDVLYTTILRKKNSKFNIIPPSSNTREQYKSCAGRTYFGMTRTHCSDPREQERQVHIVKHILKLKGFSEKRIINMNKK